jgi:hypothetical protein
MTTDTVDDAQVDLVRRGAATSMLPCGDKGEDDVGPDSEVTTVRCRSAHMHNDDRYQSSSIVIRGVNTSFGNCRPAHCPNLAEGQECLGWASAGVQSAGRARLPAR